MKIGVCYSTVHVHARWFTRQEIVPLCHKRNFVIMIEEILLGITGKF
jgi:hypothetical protein